MKTEPRPEEMRTGQTDDPSDGTLRLTVNGEERRVRDVTTVSDLLAELGIDPRRVAVERNRTVLAREELEETRLEDGDVLEIVQFVGGGRGARDESGRRES